MGTPIAGARLHQAWISKKEFVRLTKRTVYYLEPTPELLVDHDYLAMNTRLALNTAAFAVPVLLQHDPQAVRCGIHS